MQKVYVFMILSTYIIIASLANPSQASHIPPSTTRNIFKPPNESDISEAETSSIPWVLPEFVPIIEEFRDNVLEDLQSSPQLQKISDFETDSKTTRDIFFKLLNKFLTDIGHPVPAALANVLSKAESVFDPMTVPIMCKADSINLGIFLLSHNIEIDRSTSHKYIDSISSALDNANLDDAESIWEAFLNGYAGFVQSYGFELIDVIDEILEGFSSVVYVLYNNLNGLP